MSSDPVSALQQALADSEARYLDTQKQIAQLVNGFHQLQALIQNRPPTPVPQTPPPRSPPSVPTRRAPPPALPSEFDGDRSKGSAFLRSCTTYVLLCPDSFSDDQTKIVWTLSYMKSGRAAKWAARVFRFQEENEGYSKFLDWDDFKTEFRKEFCPANSEAAAINKLESMAYYQKSRSVDDYLDEFLDLIAESGYTDPKTLVVKFRRGLDPQIQNAVATMAYGRPSDTAPTAWYEAARNIDQNRASNEAFRSTYRPSFSSVLPVRPPPSAPIPVRPSPGNPVPMDVDAYRRKVATKDTGHPRRYDIRACTTEELEDELARRLAEMDAVPAEDCPSIGDKSAPTEDFQQDNE